MRPRLPHRRRALALATSLALHAGALVLLLLPAPPPPRPAPPALDPIAIEVIETPGRESSTSAPIPSPSPSPRPASRRTSRTPIATPSAPADAAGTALDLRMLPPTPSLTLDHQTLDRFAQDGIIDPTRAPAARARGPSFTEKVAALARRDQARRNVERGNVHPQAYVYMRGAQRLFRPDPEIVYRDSRAPNSVGSSVRQWARGAYNAVRPWQTREELDRERWARDPHRQGPTDLFARANGWKKGTEMAAIPMACLVCLVIQPGETARVELAASSGNREVDRAALEALQRTADRRPTDGDVRRQRSCYRFTVRVHRIPPVPIVGCSFDEAALSASCYYPTKLVTTTEVVLESVDYDG